MRLDGRLFRAFPSQTPSRERSSRCNANRFEELPLALTPSNMEGGTERPAFCDNQAAAESPFQFAFAQSVECFGSRRSLRQTKSYRVLHRPHRLVCLCSH